ncbi:MAG: NifU family protein [Acidobacteriota bacterium]
MSEVHEAVSGIEELARSLESISDPQAREAATAAVQSLMDIHAEAFERMLQIANSESFARKASEDELVGSLLLLYGLHPVPVTERVVAALTKVRPYLQSHGGNVELLRVDDGVAHLRMEGSCKGCPSSSRTLKLAVEDAIFEAAPELSAIVADDQPGVEDVAGRWEAVGDISALDGGSGRLIEVAGKQLFFCRVGDSFYAWGSQCPRCGSSLEGAAIDGSALLCPQCAQGYDLFAAGRSVEPSELHLDPFPLLVENGLARVAMA